MEDGGREAGSLVFYLKQKEIFLRRERNRFGAGHQLNTFFLVISSPKKPQALGCKVDHYEREGGGKGPGKCQQLIKREKLLHRAPHRK